MLRAAAVGPFLANGVIQQFRANDTGKNVNHARRLPRALPMPDLFVVIQQTAHVASADHLHTADAVAFGDSSFCKVVNQRENLHAFTAQATEIFVWSGGMIDAERTNLQWWALLRHEIIDGVATQQHREIGAGVLQSTS